MHESGEKDPILHERQRRIEESLSTLHEDYKDLLHGYLGDLRTIKAQPVGNDDDHVYAEESDREARFIEDRAELYARIGKTLLTAFVNLPKTGWATQEQEPSIGTSKVTTYSFPLGHRYQLRLIRSHSHPQHAGNKSFVSERWSLGVEDRIERPANDELGERFPEECHLSWGTLSLGPSVFNVKPPLSLETFEQKAFESSVQDFRLRNN